MPANDPVAVPEPVSRPRDPERASIAMSLQHTAVFLLGYFLASSAVALVPVLLGRRRTASVLLLLLCLAGLALAVAIGSLLSTGESFIVATFERLLALRRRESVAFLLGFCAALPLAAFLWGPLRAAGGRLAVTLAACGLLGTMLFGTLTAGREIISPYLPHPDTEVEGGAFGRLVPEEYRVEELAETAILPVRVAVSPSGRVYVSGHLGIAAQEGGVVELRVADDGSVTETLVAEALNRPYGLVATDERLFVSRSGQYTRWTDGRAEQISTGAVTMLEDLDGDGVMDYYHDVLRDLPGAKGPDFLHQNNGIALGPDGALYVTTANQSDGHPAEDALAGAILRASGPDFANVETYADGLRNPFGLAFDGAGRLFATDNDAQTGLLGGNLGDKLLEVAEGAFYGHPFASEADPGVAAPLLRSRFALGGLTYAASERLPAAYRDRLYVAVYGEGRIMRVNLGPDGTATLEPFAVIPGVVDIAAAPNGDFLATVYPNKIVRLVLREGGMS